MKRNQSSSARGAYRFRTTRWSVVLLAAHSETSGFKKAQAELCILYRHSLYGFVRQRDYSPENAEDLTQGFFAHLLERKTGDVAAETREHCEALIAAEGWVMP